jgi:hypothetical protein
MDRQKEAPAATEARENALNDNDGTSLSRALQRARLLKHLREVGPITTQQARNTLNIYFPPARVFELRKEGHAIQTTMVWEKDHLGRPHHVGRYALVSKRAEQ